MDFGRNFLLLCKELNIGENTFCEMEKDYYFEITVEEFYKLNNLGIIYDGTKGGLILGKSHQEGGIHFLQPISEHRLRYVGEMEGWEYLTAPIQDINLAKQFEILNMENPHIDFDIKTDFEIPKNCKVIDTSNTNVPVLLISRLGHFVLNRFATKNEINKIIEIDK